MSESDRAVACFSDVVLSLQALLDFFSTSESVQFIYLDLKLRSSLEVGSYSSGL